MADSQNTQIMSPTVLLELVKTMEAQAKADGSEYTSVHVVYSGLNAALEARGYNARESTTRAVDRGMLFGRGVRGGYMISSKPFGSSGSSGKVRAVENMIDNLGKSKRTSHTSNTR